MFVAAGSVVTLPCAPGRKKRLLHISASIPVYTQGWTRRVRGFKAQKGCSLGLRNSLCLYLRAAVHKALVDLIHGSNKHTPGASGVQQGRCSGNSSGKRKFEL
jgi:hypothetical protein